MENKKEYQVLLIRNKCSAIVDDLVSLVVNSALASELRNISEEIMALEPGFLLDQKLASNLRQYCKTTLKQYAQKQIKDVDLMTFISNTKAMLKGDKKQNGGKKMSFLKKAFQPQKTKQKQQLENLLQLLQTTQEEIIKTENKMKQCLEAARGLPRNSPAYRNKAQEYTIAQNTLTVLQKQADSLLQTKANYETAEIIRNHATILKQINVLASSLTGNIKTLDYNIAEVDLLTSKTTAHTSEIRDRSASFFESIESSGDQAFSSSDFDAKMAEEEYRHDLLEINGSFPKDGSSNREFDSLMDISDRPEQT